MAIWFTSFAFFIDHCSANNIICSEMFLPHSVHHNFVNVVPIPSVLILLSVFLGQMAEIRWAPSVCA
jgi:hypothetical protein